MSSGSEVELGIMQTNRLGCMFARPASTPPSPNVDMRSPNSTSSNQGSDSFTSSDLAIPSALSTSISDLLINRRHNRLPNGHQKPASADSILAMFRSFSSSSAAANLPSSLRVSPSTTPTASSPQDDVAGDDESSTSSIHTPVSFSSGAPESPISQRHSTIEVPVLDPFSAHKSPSSGSNLLHPPSILLEIPSTINKCLSPIREMPTPLPSPMPSPALTPIMRRSTASSSLDDADLSDDRISVEIPNISISSDVDDDDIHCPDIAIDPQAEDGLILEEAAAMQHPALHRQKNRPTPIGLPQERNKPVITITVDPPPLEIPTLIIQTPSPTHPKIPSISFPGSPPPHVPNLSNDSCFQFPSPKQSRKMLKDFDKPTSLDLPSVPPMITITYNMSEIESDTESISPAVKSTGHLGPSAGMTYLSPFSMNSRGEHTASESNLSSSGYSSMASPGPSRCGSSNPLCPGEMDDHGSAGSQRRQSITPVLKSSASPSTCDKLEQSTKEQRRGRSDSETLSDEQLAESNDEGIGTDHIDEKIDEGALKSAKELEVFMVNESENCKTMLDLPMISLLTTPKVVKCTSLDDPTDRLLSPLVVNGKNSLQLPSIVVQCETPGCEKHLSPMSSRSESPLSDRTTGMGRFSPQFYGRHKDLLPFTDSDGLYDFPSSDKVNVTTHLHHKKPGRKREKRALRNCKTPSPTKPTQFLSQVHLSHLDIPSKDSLYKVPPPRKLSPKRRLNRSQVVSSSSSSDSITQRDTRQSSSSQSPDTIRWSSPIAWIGEKCSRSAGESCQDIQNIETPSLAKSVEFSKNHHGCHQKVSRLRTISHQIRFLRRLEQSLRKRDRNQSPSDSDEDSSKVTSPLLQPSKDIKVEIRKSNSIGKLQGGGSTRDKYRREDYASSQDQSLKVLLPGHGHSD
nr:uncharacterized protein LOC111513108 [Leptinotarsa decemlineata]